MNEKKENDGLVGLYRSGQKKKAVLLGVFCLLFTAVYIWFFANTFFSGEGVTMFTAAPQSHIAVSAKN